VAATIIVVLTLGFTLYAVESATFVSLGGYSQLQLMPVADSLMQNFILSAGAPSDWGSNLSVSANQLQSFGLAAAWPNAGAYSLDPNKLNRIINTTFVRNDYYIPPSVVGKLLGIYQNNHFIYGFDFRLIPALNITLNQIASNSTMTLYQINVTDYTGQPAVNAHVKVSQISFCSVIIGNNNNVPISFGANSSTNQGVTDINGSISVYVYNPSATCQASNGQEKVEIANVTAVSASFYGLQFESLFGINACKAQMMIQGQLLIANFTGSSKSGACANLSADIKSNQNNNNGAVFPVFTSFQVTSDLNIILNPVVNQSTGGQCSLLNHGANNYCVYQLKYPVSSSTVFAGLIIVVNPGNGGSSGKEHTYFVVASNPSTPNCIIEYTSNSLVTSQSVNTCGPSYNSLKIAQVQSAVTITRFVTIGINTWYATLTVWRMGS